MFIYIHLCFLLFSMYSVGFFFDYLFHLVNHNNIFMMFLLIRFGIYIRNECLHYGLIEVQQHEYLGY